MARSATIPQEVFLAAIRDARKQNGSNKDAIRILNQKGYTISDAVFSQRKAKEFAKINARLEEIANLPSSPELQTEYNGLTTANDWFNLSRSNSNANVSVFDSIQGLL